MPQTNTIMNETAKQKALTTSHKGFSAFAISRVTTISGSLFCICIITRIKININTPIYTCILKYFEKLLTFNILFTLDLYNGNDY